MNIPIELTPEYQEEVERWRRIWGYEPKRDDIVRILAKKELKEELQRLFDEFRVNYNISGREFKQAAKEASQKP
jgi:hypothetical protein